MTMTNIPFRANPALFRPAKLDVGGGCRLRKNGKSFSLREGVITRALEKKMAIQPPGGIENRS
jgi:hypothetical protein